MCIASLEEMDLGRGLHLEAVGSVQLSPCMKRAGHGPGCFGLQNSLHPLESSALLNTDLIGVISGVKGFGWAIAPDTESLVLDL